MVLPQASPLSTRLYNRAVVEPLCAEINYRIEKMCSLIDMQIDASHLTFDPLTRGSMHGACLYTEFGPHSRFPLQHGQTHRQTHATESPTRAGGNRPNKHNAASFTCTAPRYARLRDAMVAQNLFKQLIFPSSLFSLCN